MSTIALGEYEEQALQELIENERWRELKQMIRMLRSNGYESVTLAKLAYVHYKVVQGAESLPDASQRPFSD